MLIDEDENDEVTESSAIPANERKLVTQSYDLSVATLMEWWEDQTLVLPEIQREYVWTNSKASRLVESLLLNVPIPVLYFAEATEETYEVIDGHQRIRSIARYINNEFSLSGLRILADKEHVGKRFHQLPLSDQRRIRTRVIRAIIITEESHPSMKFEVFERLNTGSIALNAQEIRNSTHRGPFMQKIKELVQDPDFRHAIGQKQPRRRMADNELLIRFFALREDLYRYRPPVPRFLNSYCEVANRFDDVQMRQLEEAFGLAIENATQTFGDNTFRITDETGARTDRSINKALAETQLLVFSYCDKSDVVSNRDKLIRELGELHAKPEFLDDIQRATSDRARTLGRVAQYVAAVRKAGVRIDGLE